MKLEEMKQSTIEKYEKILDLLREGEIDRARELHGHECNFCKKHILDCENCEVSHLCYPEGSLHDRILPETPNAEELVLEMIEELKKIGTD